MSKAEIINRQEFDVARYQRAPSGALLVVARYTFMLIVSEIILSFLLFGLIPNGILGDVSTILSRFIIGLIILLPVIFLLGVFLVKREWANTEYAVQSGRYRKIDDFVDQKPGHISMKQGAIVSKINHYPANLFKRAELIQTIIGNRLGFATVVLEPHTGNRSVMMRYVKDAPDLVFKAQLVIDSANSNDNQLN